MNIDSYLLSVRYGQRLVKEILHAQAVAKFLKAKEHKIINMPGFKEISFSPITGQIPVPEDGIPTKFAKTVPLNYPPGRDHFILVLACAWAESLWLYDVENISKAKAFIGTNAFDSSNYPDCKKGVYKKWNEILAIGTKIAVDFGKKIEIVTPLINKDKHEVVKFGLEIGAPLHLTWSCYKGGEKACGKCDACKLRLRAFEINKAKDQIEYE